MVLNKHLLNAIQLLGSTDYVKLSTFNIDFQKINVILADQIIEQYCGYLDDVSAGGDPIRASGVDSTGIGS